MILCVCCPFQPEYDPLEEQRFRQAQESRGKQVKKGMVFKRDLACCRCPVQGLCLELNLKTDLDRQPWFPEDWLKCCFLIAHLTDDPYYCGLRARIPNFAKTKAQRDKEASSRFAASQQQLQQVQQQPQPQQQQILPPHAPLPGQVPPHHPMMWHRGYLDNSETKIYRKKTTNIGYRLS